jgi:hypothetical protein
LRLCGESFFIHESARIVTNKRSDSREFVDKFLLCVLCGSVVNSASVPEQTNHEAHQEIRPGAKATQEDHGQQRHQAISTGHLASLVVGQAVISAVPIRRAG